MSKKKEKNYQFFTTDQGLLVGTWFPMDHFFYALRESNKNGMGYNEDTVNKVVHLEGHATLSRSGHSVSIIQPGKKTEELPDYPSALRRMADIIEQSEKKQRKVK